MGRLLFKEDNSNSDSEPDLRINTSYASNYNNWRGKEEFQKLKDRFGDSEALDDSKSGSSSSETEDEAEKLDPEVDKNFFRTLSLLKQKDPLIYDRDTKFFDSEKGQEEGEVESGEKSKKKTKKEKSVFLRDYEREQVLKTGAVADDEKHEDIEEEVSSVRPASPTYNEEQSQIKESFKEVMADSEGEEEKDDESSWGGFLKKRTKTKEEQEKEEAEYLAWLKGNAEHLNNEKDEKDLKCLQEYWSNPSLDPNEAFLKDYILNKRYLDDDNKDDYIPTYDQVVHDSEGNLSEDEKTLEQQETFEHKYNFRFEEPDPEFIKRYPRTVKDSLRRTEDKRKQKRQDLRQRKDEMRKEKEEEIKRLKALKRQEIVEKLDKIKEITGNTELGFREEDIGDDFDPEAHDRRMQQLFSEDYYAEAGEEQKPEFPKDDEIDDETWNQWEEYEEGTEDNPEELANASVDYEPHCEDPDFNMDCEAGQSSSYLEEAMPKGKVRKKSRFMEALARKKPKFDSSQKSFEEYFDEYYKLDCEDIIGDLPCRYKYRKVLPNSYGLTIEEILQASDRELNKWCSLKKMTQYRPTFEEERELGVFGRKAKSEWLKRKILPSLYAEDPESVLQEEIEHKQEKRQKKKRKRRGDDVDEDEVKEEHEDEPVPKKQKTATETTSECVVSAETDVSNKKKKKKKKKQPEQENVGSNLSRRKKKNRRKKTKQIGSNGKTSVTQPQVQRRQSLPANKKNRRKQNKNGPVVGMSDERLRAYGIHPKKFKNKLIYGPKKS